MGYQKYKLKEHKNYTLTNVLFVSILITFLVQFQKHCAAFLFKAESELKLEEKNSLGFFLKNKNTFFRGSKK